MTRTLIAAACLGLSLSAASACDHDRSAETEVDQTVGGERDCRAGKAHVDARH